jgi:hypothetical protein
MNMGTDDTERPQPQRKVGILLHEYDLDNLRDNLGAMWLGEDGYEEMGIRKIAKQINIQIVKENLKEVDDPLEGEAENVYDLLTQDESGIKVSQENKLERMGIDPETLQRDFVSRSSVHRYLTDVLRLSKKSESTDPVERSRRMTEKFQSRTETILSSHMSRLAESDEFRLGNPEVTVNYSVYCSECDSQYDVYESLDRGGCNCSESEH